MPGFESITEQDRPVRILTSLLKNGTIPHAMLFTGIEGVGRKSAAVAFAMACNCEAGRGRQEPEKSNALAGNHSGAVSPPLPVNACGRCKSCKKIESGNHPDIIHVKPSGVSIKIDQIRRLCQTLAMKPYEARTRVVIISDAPAMNPAAGNALLKMLEEPPAGTSLILLASQTSDLLPTIVSRCQHIRFNPIPRKSLESLLTTRHGLEHFEAGVIAAMAGGSISRALAMHRTHWIKRRNWLIRELQALPEGTLNRLLAFSEQLAKNKNELPEALEIMTTWLRDLAVEKVHAGKIRNRDLAQTVKSEAQKNSLASLLAKIDIVQAAGSTIKAGTNVRLAMEAMMLKLARV